MNKNCRDQSDGCCVARLTMKSICQEPAMRFSADQCRIMGCRGARTLRTLLAAKVKNPIKDALPEVVKNYPLGLIA